jgi:hypothetical protein
MKAFIDVLMKGKKISGHNFNSGFFPEFPAQRLLVIFAKFYSSAGWAPEITGGPQSKVFYQQDTVVFNQYSANPNPNSALVWICFHHAFDTPEVIIIF